MRIFKILTLFYYSVCSDYVRDLVSNSREQAAALIFDVCVWDALARAAASQAQQSRRRTSLPAAKFASPV